MKKYDPAFYAQSAKDLPKTSEEIQKLVDDYGKLRAACRSLSE